MKRTAPTYGPRPMLIPAGWLSLAAAFLCSPTCLLAAPMQTQPTARRDANRLMQWNLVPLETAPAVNLDAVTREDEAREATGLAPRFAITNPVVITPRTHGLWERVDPDTMVWRLRISSPGAKSLNLGFTQYHMPEGGRLFLYTPNFSQVIRPFTADDNAAHNQLWTPIVQAEQLVVEVTVPAKARGALVLKLTSINVGYRGFGGGPQAVSGSCNIDVICSEGDAWRDEIRAIGIYSVGGAVFCTGAMMNNTAEDRTPNFLTADHCGINAGTAPSLVVYWNYENSSCRATNSPASGGPGDGTLTQFQTGSIFRAGNTATDFTLVELDEDPDPAWGVTFAGWDRSSADADSAVAIHHPSVDEKRISFENEPTTTTSLGGTAVPGDGRFIRVRDWDLGTTEPGSSGSPLFDQNHRVIGQLQGGLAACGNNDSDWYGRLSRSWDGGGRPSSRLLDWLDPGDTGDMSVDTLVTDPVPPTGACCDGRFCSPQTEAFCLSILGTYQGDDVACQGTPGPTTSHSNSPNVAIPDDGGPGNPATDTINVTDSVIIGDVEIDLTISHTWVGDLIVTVSHGGRTVTIVDRPDFPRSELGCDVANFDDARLDDEGIGGAFERQCSDGLSSPPSYTPYQPLSAFDGMASAGDWTIRVSDNASLDTGTLQAWSVHIAEADLDSCDEPCSIDSDCDNDLVCDGQETCDGTGVCQPGTPVVCDDGAGCTVDSCDPDTGLCDSAPDDLNCNDDMSCTNDTCDPSNPDADSESGCVHAIASGSCSIGDVCYNDQDPNPNNDCEACVADVASDAWTPLTDTTLCTDDGNDCTDDVCDGSGTCIHPNRADGTNCDDGSPCTNSDACGSGICGGTTIDCSALNDDCKTGVCNTTTGNCEAQPGNDGGACDDGDPCTTSDTCTSGACAGNALDCSHLDDQCNRGVCNAGTGVCEVQPVADGLACDDDLFCNGTESCVDGQCQSTGDPCVGSHLGCDEVNDGCVCNDDDDCDDGLFCTGPESCVDGDCQSAGNPCISRPAGCDEDNDSCGGCNTDADCDDGDPSTLDRCDTAGDKCKYASELRVQGSDSVAVGATATYTSTIVFDDNTEEDATDRATWRVLDANHPLVRSFAARLSSDGVLTPEEHAYDSANPAGDLVEIFVEAKLGVTRLGGQTYELAGQKRVSILPPAGDGGTIGQPVPTLDGPAPCGTCGPVGMISSLLLLIGLAGLRSNPGCR